MVETQELLKLIKSYNSNVNEKKIIDACEFSKKAHENQIRASGEPYYHHPLAVANILANMKLDEDSIITALLHDTVEDTIVSLEDISNKFGPNIAKLVDGVTKLAKIKFQPDNIRQAENFRKLLLAMSEDIRVLIVKLADRLHNVRTINFLSEKKAVRIALETLEIYGPLAERVGMQKIKNELEDLSFAKLYPEERKSILSRLQYLKQDDGSLIDRIETQIKKILKDVGIETEVLGREKSPCSIWNKMKQKKVSFEQLSDVIAFRVIVNDVLECYHVLGIIHSAYRMIPGSFKDYISLPKDNGYSSLHTVVVGPEKQKIEIQVRTREMNMINEWGVAAHWSYKQFINLKNLNFEGKQYRWIRELLKILENSETDEFIEHTKMEMYEHQVFCFTPRGELIALPRGATPIDFAYALHSDVGNQCIGAKINGKIIPLRHELQNGDQVEILTSKKQEPSVMWEKFVVTARAKSEIKKYLKLEQKKEYSSLGKVILTKFLTQENVEYSEDELKKCLDSLQKKSLTELYEAVGEGTITRTEVLNLIIKQKSNLQKLKSKFSFFKLKKKNNFKENYIPIKGIMPGIVMNYGECCHPLPGDSILGVFHDDKKIMTIHTADCEKLAEFKNKTNEIIEVSWDKYNDQTIHTTKLKATITNEPNSLATICQTIANYDCNISNLKFISRSTDFFEILIDIEVMGITQLTNIIASLRSRENVHHVDRYKH